MRHEVKIKEIEQFYFISPDGEIYSKLRKRWMKLQQNNSGYIHVFITHGVSKPIWLFCHTLVALKYIGEPPTAKHEINHIDENKAHNNFLNLEWVTKSVNHLKAYENGKDHFWKDKHRPSPGVETRLLMANAKNKRILFVFKDQRIIYESINDAASQLQTYRKKIYNCIKDNKPIKGGYLSYIHDEPPTE